MKRDIVVETFVGQGCDPLDMPRREIGTQLDDDIAAAGEGKGQGVGIGHRRVAPCHGKMERAM